MSKHEDLLKQKKVDGIKFVWIHHNLWRCPKCGGVETFIYDPDCTYIDMETDDWLLASAPIDCENKSAGCSYGTTVGRFFSSLSKALDLVPCPHCRGTGMIKADKKGKTS